MLNENTEFSKITSKLLELDITHDISGKPLTHKL